MGASSSSQTGSVQLVLDHTNCNSTADNQTDTLSIESQETVA